MMHRWGVRGVLLLHVQTLRRWLSDSLVHLGGGLLWLGGSLLLLSWSTLFSTISLVVVSST